MTTTSRLIRILGIVALAVFGGVIAAAQQPGGSVGTLPPGVQARGAAGPITQTPGPAPAQAARPVHVPHTPVGSRTQPGGRFVAPANRSAFVAPFPNIATLSGPLTGGLNPPLAPNIDLYRYPLALRYGSQFYPGYAYGGYAAPPGDETMANQTQAATGTLRLQGTPGSAEVFVDGYYAGTIDDIDNRRGLTVAAGPHTVAVRARGYEPLAVPVRVAPNDVVTYRTTLDAQQQPATNAAAPRVAENASTIWVIPGCYMGNVPPRKERVAAGCDVSQARIVTPHQGAEAPSRPPRARP